MPNTFIQLHSSVLAITLLNLTVVFIFTCFSSLAVVCPVVGMQNAKPAQEGSFSQSHCGCADGHLAGCFSSLLSINAGRPSITRCRLRSPVNHFDALAHRPEGNGRLTKLNHLKMFSLKSSVTERKRI